MLLTGRLEPVPSADRDQLARLLPSQPWAPALLAALEGVDGVHLVGGAVRDLALGRDPVDVDLAVEGEAAEVASRLGERLKAQVVVHDRFGTATVLADPVPINLATVRAESYAAPGALPDVRPGTIDEDLARRDFTINAMALALPGGEPDVLRAAPRAAEDLAAGIVRILHPGSFVDDPTRLLRAVRYATRLGFELEEETARLAREAAGTGALRTVSGSRVRDELLDLLGEPGAPASLGRLADLGLDRALHPGFGVDPPTLERALALAPADARRDLIALGLASAQIPVDDLRAWLGELDLSAAEREVVVAVAGAGDLAARLQSAARASEIAAAASSASESSDGCSARSMPSSRSRSSAVGASTSPRRSSSSSRTRGPDTVDGAPAATASRASRSVPSSSSKPSLTA